MKVLIIGLVWPEPTSSAAGWRMMHLIKLLALENEVYFVSAASKSEFSEDLSALGVIESNITLNDSSFDNFISELLPDVVLFDRFMIEEQYGWRVHEACPNALRILDTEDLHFLRLARQESFKKGSELNLQSGVAKREIASILRSDLSLIISTDEMNLLKNEFHVHEQQLFYIPFQEQVIADQKRLIFEDRNDFVFIGNFIHEPNWKTVEVLKKEIWHVLRKKVPNAELHIYGAYPSQKVFQLHNEREGFLIKGRVEDARKTIEKYKVLLAPIPFGAGTKGKFVDSMYAGTPTVSSTVGAEAMQSHGSWNGFITDDIEEFTEKASLLYYSKQEWEAAQQRGFKLFNESFANNVYSERLLAWIKDSAKDIHKLRRHNFIGQILLHNQFNATKYMSMWIEEKNKKLPENK